MVSHNRNVLLIVYLNKYSNNKMATSFTDCCIRYGQEFLYTKFSKGNMILGEIYMALVYGLILIQLVY